MLANQPYDEKVDMWAIGVILYNLLSGEAPWDDDDRTFKLTFGKDWKDISDEAKDLISKLLTIDPKKRYSAKEALEHKWLVIKYIYFFIIAIEYNIYFF